MNGRMRLRQRGRSGQETREEANKIDSMAWYGVAIKMMVLPDTGKYHIEM